MSKTYHLHTSQLRAAIDQLQAGDRVLLTGTIYTARDAAHKRLFALLDEGKELPFPLKDAGPTPAQQGLPMGACGPTTASRMNAFAPRLLDLGLAAIIGKGQMSEDVAQALIRNHSCFFAAVGGAGALIARCIHVADVIAFDELGCESIKRFQVEDLPLTVAMDCHGGNLYQSGRKLYQVI